MPARGRTGPGLTPRGQSRLRGTLSGQEGLEPMKILLLAFVVLAQTASACSIQTIFLPGGSVVTCTVCCFGGNCITTCT